MKTAYDPAATFELKVTEVDLRRAPGGRMLMARVLVAKPGRQTDRAREMVKAFIARNLAA